MKRQFRGKFIDALCGRDFIIGASTGGRSFDCWLDGTLF